MIVILFEPSYMKPYLTDIDALLENKFSCMINCEGGGTITAYNLTIYNSSDVQVYTTGRIELTASLYNGDILELTIPNTSGMVNGTDYYWNIMLYENKPTMWVAYGATLVGSTTTILKIRPHYNVKPGMYIKLGNDVRKITVYNQTTGSATVDVAFAVAPLDKIEYSIYSDFIVSEDCYYKARKTPEVTIDNIPELDLESRTFEFIGSYVQDNGVVTNIIDRQNVAWRSFMWKLYDSSGNLIETTPEKSTGDIKHTFDGLFDNAEYQIELIVENQDGVVVTSERYTFVVNYLEPVVLNRPTTEVLRDKDAVKVFWEQPIINLGTVSTIEDESVEGQYEISPDFPYENHSSLTIYSGSKLFYEPATSVERISIPYNSSTFMFINLHSLFNGWVTKLENTETGDYYILSYENGYIYYDINTVYVAALKIADYMDESFENIDLSDETTFLEVAWLKLILLPTKVILDSITIDL